MTTQHLDDADIAAAPAHLGPSIRERPEGDYGGERSEFHRRDLLLAFIDRRRLQERLDEVVIQAGWRAAEPSHSRQELMLRLDWRRLEERFGAILREEAAASIWRFGNRYAHAVRAVEEIHLPVTDAQGNRFCAADGELYACRTLREVYAAQDMAWDGWDDHGYPNWRSFNDEEAAASREGHHRTGLHWRPGIGLDHHTGPAVAAPDRAGQLAELGRRAQLARDAVGLTRYQVAELAGIPAGQLYALEAGDWNIDIRSVFRLAAALGVPATVLIPDHTTTPEPEDLG